MSRPVAINLPRAIEEEIRRHAEAQRPGWESAGRLAVRVLDLRVVRYQPLANRAKAPGIARFSMAVPPIADGHVWLSVHSHPGAEHNYPSSRDLAAAVERRMHLLGIWATDTLHVWRVVDRGDVRSIPITVIDA